MPKAIQEFVNFFFHREVYFCNLFFTGTPEQIKICRQLIQEKVDSRDGGGMGRGPMPGGPPQHTPPPGNFLPQQVRTKTRVM